MKASNASTLLLVAGGALALVLLSSSKAKAAQQGEPGEPGETDAERIVRESKEIIQGKRDEYSDKPGEKVSDIDAARRVKEERDRLAREEAQAIEAARRALELERAQAEKDAKPTDTALTTISVKTAQGYLRALGYVLERDGLYGVKTRAAWEDACKARDLPWPFVRKTATSATTNKLAVEGILAAVRAKQAAKPAPKPAPKPSQPAQPAQPAGAQPPEGFDREKASRAAPDIAKHLSQKGISHYSRPALRIWQKLAGVAQDGIYGRGTAAALRYFVGAKAPRPFFAQGVDTYPWGQ